MKDVKAITMIIVTILIIGCAISTNTGAVQLIRIKYVEDMTYICEEYNLIRIKAAKDEAVRLYCEMEMAKR